MSFATAVGGTFAQALGGIGIGVVVIRYLYGLYEAVYVDAFLEGNVPDSSPQPDAANRLPSIWERISSTSR